MIISPLRSEDSRRASNQIVEATISSKHPSSTLCDWPGEQNQKQTCIVVVVSLGSYCLHFAPWKKNGLNQLLETQQARVLVNGFWRRKKRVIFDGSKSFWEKQNAFDLAGLNRLSENRFKPEKTRFNR